MNDLNGETWKPIPGFPGYDVSDHGRIRSYRRRYGVGNWITEQDPQRILRQGTKSRGYKFVQLMNGSGVEVKQVHSLVMLAFVGPCPDGLEICHNDNDPSNNSLSNLRYDTHIGNMRDRRDILSSQDVLEIRELMASHADLNAIAAAYNVCRETIRNVATGKTHRDVGGPISTMQPPFMGNKSRSRRVYADRVAGASLKELSKKYGLSLSAISRICNGKRAAAYGRKAGQPGKGSRYRGVSRNGNKWVSQIKIGGEIMYLGVFADEIDAARAYDDTARKYGKVERVNFPAKETMP